uniref:Uncharacterized protein n=1 Tax=Hyaloperonospora arabidopsidis (strain Emoy2) TaxID=559515 RepID=M4BN27_HYAAE
MVGIHLDSSLHKMRSTVAIVRVHLAAFSCNELMPMTYKNQRTAHRTSAYQFVQKREHCHCRFYFTLDRLAYDLDAQRVRAERRKQRTATVVQHGYFCQFRFGDLVYTHPAVVVAYRSHGILRTLHARESTHNTVGAKLSVNFQVTQVVTAKMTWPLRHQGKVRRRE